jgi:hypothetical protein
VSWLNSVNALAVLLTYPLQFLPAVQIFERKLGLDMASAAQVNVP